MKLTRQSLFRRRAQGRTPAEGLSLANLWTRVEVIHGIVDSDSATREPDTDVIIQARRLADDASQLLTASDGGRIALQQVALVGAKVTACEILILSHLSPEYLASVLRDSCMNMLVLLEGTVGEHVFQERRFVSGALEKLNSGVDIEAGELRRLYLQARHRLDAVLAAKVSVTCTADRFLSTLWLKTSIAVLICSVPVTYFLYDRYWPEGANASGNNEQSVVKEKPPMFDVTAAQDAQLVIPILESDLKKLPKVSKKPNLDLNDIREFADKPYTDFASVSTTGHAFLETVVNIASDPNAPPELAELGKEFVDIEKQSNSETQRKVRLIAALRKRQDKLPALRDYLSEKIEEAKTVPTPSPSVETPQTEDESFLERLHRRTGAGESFQDPVARVAALFSVMIMGMLGAFVSNYSRVCALVRDAAAVSTSTSDSRLRVRFSPFLGGLLAIVLAEIFGGHLLQGDLFPMAEKMPRWTDLIWHGQAFSKLLVWGFVAGLSENHVLRVLGGLVSRISPDEKGQPAARS